MNRRSLLKLLPLAAVAGTTVKVNGADATLHELRPEKAAYLLHVRNYNETTIPALKSLAENLRARGVNISIIASDSDLALYEVDQR